MGRQIVVSHSTQDKCGKGAPAIIYHVNLQTLIIAPKPKYFHLIGIYCSPDHSIFLRKNYDGVLLICLEK